MESLHGDQTQLWVAATPQAVYRLVSDVTRTPEWSPEVIECHWLDDTPPDTPPARPGARFQARNKRRWFAWSNTPVVEVADPPQEFAFVRTEPGGGSIRWSYQLEPDRDGTMITHAFTILAPVPAGLQWFLRIVFGVRDLQADLHTNITGSLERLAAVATHDANHDTTRKRPTTS